MSYLISSEFEPKLNRWIVNLSGEIDIFNASDFKRDLQEIVDNKQADIYIDCKNLEYMDSTALGSLVTLLKKVRENDDNIYLLNLKPNIEKLFVLTNLDKAFKILGGEKSE